MNEILNGINGLKEPKSLEEMNQQLGSICDAVEKCEKMLQHMAVSNMDGATNSSEINTLMSQHTELMRKKNYLLELKEAEKNKKISSENLLRGNKPNISEIEFDSGEAEESGLIYFIKKIFHAKKRS